MSRWRFALLVALAISASVVTANQTVIFVDDDAAPGGNGSARFPYRDLHDAVTAANAVSGPVLIKVEPGDYVLAAPLLVGRSIELRGSTELMEGDDGWPTGEAVPGTETRIIAANPGGSESLFVIGRADAGVLDDIGVRGFVFHGAIDGLEVLLTRVRNFSVTGNIFRGPAFLGLQSVASSGRATGNHFSGVGTGAALTGGYPASPSSVVFTGNRSVRNRFGGLLLNGASINLPDLGDQLEADVRGNDLSDNTNSATGFGLRLFILRRDPGEPGDSQSSARIRAVVQGNRIVGNVLGVSIDAGFPHRRAGTLCDPRVFSGEINVSFADNTLAGSLLTPGLVTFTRNTAALSAAMLSQWQYLHAATFEIADRDGILANAWFDHPKSDPFIGPCAGDATHEPLENVLIYNGFPVLNDRNY